MMATPTQVSVLNQPDNMTDEAGDTRTYYLFKLIDIIFSDYISIVLSAVGIPANAVSCLVFWRQGLRDRVNLCLFSLALFDLSVFCCNFVKPVVLVGFDFFDKSLRDEYFMKSMLYTLGVTYGLRATSDAISSIIAVERCLCVLLPLQVTHLVRMRTMAATILTCFLFLQLCYVVLPLKFTVERCYVNSTSSFEWKIVQTDLELKYANILDPLFNTFLSVSLPIFNFVTVSTATAVTVARLRSASRWREKIASTHTECRDRQTAATRMLVLVSCLYIVTMAPSVASIIARLIVRDFSPYGRYYMMYSAVLAAADQLSVVNDAANFFVYVAQSSRFRRHLRAMLRCGHRDSSASTCTADSSASMCTADSSASTSAVWPQSS